MIVPKLGFWGSHKANLNGMKACDFGTAGSPSSRVNSAGANAGATLAHFHPGTSLTPLLKLFRWHGSETTIAARR
jgi:hypothetical protein